MQLCLLFIGVAEVAYHSAVLCCLLKTKKMLLSNHRPHTHYIVYKEFTAFFVATPKKTKKMLV